jgi:hypothetical protein
MTQQLRRELMPRMLVLACITPALLVATNFVQPGTF